MKVRFTELWVGDRFRRVEGEKMLWTKIDFSVARQHSAESIGLGDEGVGYRGDTICSFAPGDTVYFQPPSLKP